MTTDETLLVRVWPDGTNQVIESTSTPTPTYLSDDFIIRQTAVCNECGTVLDVEYDTPYAHCECGTQEWYI